MKAVRKRSRVVATLAVALVGGALVVAGCGSDSADLPDGTAARVGDTPISQTQLNRSVAQTVAAYESQGQAAPAKDSDEFAQVEQQAMQTLVQQKIIALEAAACGAPCAVSDAAVTKELTSIVATEFDASQKKFNDFLKERKMSRADARDIVRNSLLQQKLYDHVTKDITFTEKDAKAYYEKHPDEFHKAAGRTASHILVATEAKANAIRAEVTPQNFAQLAKKNSTDAGSAALGGSLGTIEKGQMVAPFEKVAFSLKDGQISQPVKTQFGWHIIMAKLTPASTTSFAAAKATIMSTQLLQAQQKAYSDWAEAAIARWEGKTVYANDDLKPQTDTTSSTTGTTTAP